MKKNEKIDKKLCKFCDFGDKQNKKNEKSVCLNKMFGRNCVYDK